jgi:hypothetical protein
LHCLWSPQRKQYKVILAGTIKQMVGMRSNQ